MLLRTHHPCHWVELAIKLKIKLAINATVIVKEGGLVERYQVPCASTVDDTWMHVTCTSCLLTVEALLLSDSLVVLLSATLYC